jgi:hypothetical protein
MKRKFDSDNSSTLEKKEKKEVKKKKTKTIVVVTEKSQELEYKRVRRLEEDVRVPIKQFRLECEDVQMDNNIIFTNEYNARSLETVQRYFINRWLTKQCVKEESIDRGYLEDEDEDDRSLLDDYSDGPIVPLKMTDTILRAFSEIQPDEMKNLRDCKTDKKKKWYKWLRSQNWQKVPYWLVSMIIKLLRCSEIESWNIYQYFPKSLNIAAERRNKVREVLSETGETIRLDKNIVDIIVNFLP